MTFDIEMAMAMDKTIPASTATTTDYVDLGLDVNVSAGWIENILLNYTGGPSMQMEVLTSNSVSGGALLAPRVIQTYTFKADAKNVGGVISPDRDRYVALRFTASAKTVLTAALHRMNEVR